MSASPSNSRLKLGRHAPRSKTGCNTCLARKVKCDEQRPICRRCAVLKRDCDWTVRKRRKSGPRKKDHRVTSPIKPLRPRQPGLSGFQDGPTARSPSFSTTADSAQSSCSDVLLLGLQDDRAPVKSCDALYSGNGCCRASLYLVSPVAASPNLLLFPTLSASHIPCANSLLLTPHDWECLDYYPNTSMVLEYRKPWQWSKLSYIKQKIVPNDQLVMRMMLAISASEIHQRKRDEITANGTSSDIGLAHYSLAVKDLSMSLAQKSYGNEKQRLESLLPALFFMIEYEVRFGYSRRHLRLHLEGVRSLYNSYESMLLNTALENGEQHQTGTRWGGQVDDGLSFLSSQILLWISYLDVIGGQGLCSRSLMTRMSESAVPQLKIELLYRKSRLAGRHIWAGEYPENEVLDDIENYRPLELLHLNNLLRSRIWQLGVSRSEGQQTEDSPEMLMEDLTKIADKYQDILMTASLPATGQTRRVFHTMRCAASSYWAQILFYYRMFDCSQTQTQVAINNILQITRTDYERGRRFLAPHTWALLMAGLQTRDTACRAWILARIQDLSGLHSESPLVTEALQDAMRSGKTDTLDLMTLFRSGCG